MNKTERAKGFRSLVRKIEKSNKTFKKATQAQKIVLVAKDVLSMLNLKRIEATQGVYVHIEMPDSSTGKQMSDILKLPELPTCNVCAIGGAMLASTIRLNDVVDDGIRATEGVLIACYEDGSMSYDNSTNNGMSENAYSVFPNTLLKLMEGCFEQGYYGYHRVKTSSGRLKAIYQNLIDNGGRQFTAYRSKKVAWDYRVDNINESLDY